MNVLNIYFLASGTVSSLSVVIKECFLVFYNHYLYLKIIFKYDTFIMTALLIRYLLLCNEKTH